MCQAVRLDLAYMVDLLADYDFDITEEEAFEAWLWACDVGEDPIIWDSPLNYSDEAIVYDVKRFYVPDDWAVDFVLLPDEWIDDDWFEAELASYIPKTNAKVEGEVY
jgi:hypothetical protein